MVQKLYIQYVVLAFVALVFFFGAVLPAFAHGDENRRGKNATTTSEMRDKKGKTASSTAIVNLSCMQTAVETRETSLGTAFSNFHDDVEEALAARKASLKTAWGLTNSGERNSAIRSAWQAWKKGHGDALKLFKKDRKAAWDTFKKTVKDTCKEKLPKEEALTSDGEGSLSL